VLEDYDEQMRALRRGLGLSQAALAMRIGTANKAVVYQWDSRKRKPSPVFWQLMADTLRP
jgi:DNA-binding transcriptional regulator YiaG